MPVIRERRFGLAGGAAAAGLRAGRAGGGDPGLVHEERAGRGGADGDGVSARAARHLQPRRFRVVAQPNEESYFCEQ